MTKCTNCGQKLPENPEDQILLEKDSLTTRGQEYKLTVGYGTLSPHSWYLTEAQLKRIAELVKKKI